MRLTRQAIENARVKAIVWLPNNLHKIMLETDKLMRGYLYQLDTQHFYHILNNIELVYDDSNSCWAETDGETIWLNTYKNWTEENLKFTLIHEALHGVIKRNGIHDTTEYKEHIMMENVESMLV